MKKNYTRKQIQEAINYWNHKLKMMNEEIEGLEINEKFLECANKLYTLLKGDVGYRVYNKDKEQLLNILLPYANEQTNFNNLKEFLSNQKFKNYANSILKIVYNGANIDDPTWYFTTDEHGDKVIIVGRFTDNIYLGICNGDKFETPEFYYTFYDNKGRCINGNREETWLDVYSLDKPRTIGLKEMNHPNFPEFSSIEIDKKLNNAGFKKYIG